MLTHSKAVLRGCLFPCPKGGKSLNQLVIAEKPSVARSIAAVIGATKGHEGYLSGGGSIVSWCFGHLAGLSDASAYHPDFAKWRLQDLPILPDPFQFTIVPDKQKQFAVLRELLRAPDVSEVVNACDAGREGELIFRTVYELAGCTKPVKRLWISSMEDGTIREGFQNLRPGGDYDGLYQSALCRAKADWLVGINATRYFSLRYGRTLHIGRVMSPTLAMLVRREAEIAAFLPEPFYTVQLDCGFPATTERLKDRSAADAVAADCENRATVTRIERRERSEKPPALYDLTSLQRDANRTLGYTAQQTLDYLQALYEQKLCTYPRTDSRFLTDDMEEKVPAYVAAAAAVCGLAEPAHVNAGQVCASKKVSDHHAILPTLSAGRADLNALTLGEREVLKLAALGLLRAVSDSYCYTETAIELRCGGHSFAARGKTVQDPGWKVYAQQQREHTLPELTEGQVLQVTAATVKEGKTTPPRHYTEDTLLSGMETAGAGDMPEEAERKGLGTPATRAAILEKLVSSGFVERSRAKTNTALLPTALGTALITVLPESLQSPLLTAEWEHWLKEVEHGELAPEDFMEGIAAMLRELIRTYKPIPGAEVLFPSDREIIGKCPRCGKNVVEKKPGFFCEDRACSFALWKDSRFFTAKKQQLTKKAAAALLEDGKVQLTGCYSPRTGKTYDATVYLVDDGKQVSFRMDFPKGGDPA
ncbi:MAG: DNA topoisomerase III [Oscillospiraceae bacterium]|nr:DNA topoisomerase III [Oscillospiraceae bacterium]